MTPSSQPPGASESTAAAQVDLQQAWRGSPVVTPPDEDSLDEVIICDGPQNESWEEPAPPAGVPPDQKPPGILAVPTVDLTTGSTSGFGAFVKSERRSAGPVPCHYCPKASCQNAIKTCLVCGASMCSEHLLPHLESSVFQNHTLVYPVEDLSIWRCQEHQEINHIYCRQCGVCVCTVCRVIGAHRSHACISVREAEKELRVSAVREGGGGGIESKARVVGFVKIIFRLEPLGDLPPLVRPQGNLKGEIAQLQQLEERVSIKLNELAQKKEASRVRKTRSLLVFICFWSGKLFFFSILAKALI